MQLYYSCINQDQYIYNIDVLRNTDFKYAVTLISIIVDLYFFFFNCMNLINLISII